MDPFIGEIRIMSFNFAPKGWALCNGQLLPINQNQALFSLLGNSFGGDGRSTFALPNLQGRVPMHEGTHGFASFGGQETHTLLPQEMPAHTHNAAASRATASQGAPTNNYLASSNSLYGPAPGNTALAPTTITSVGGNQPHENRQPYLTLSFAIALTGIYPSRN